MSTTAVTETSQAAMPPTINHTIQSIIKCAGRGFKQVEIARTVGVEESYVSQILSTPEYAALVEQFAVAQTEENERFDEKLDKTEATALEIVARKLNMATNLRDALNAATRLNAMKRRRDTAPATRAPQATVVPLILPQIAVVNYVANAKSEIVEVEGRTMLSASPASLEALAQKVLGRELRKPVENAVPLPQDSRAEVVLQQLENSPRRRTRASDISISDLI